MDAHERQWKSLTVDKGLTDEWLESINSLRCFSPYSTCEGHSNPVGAGGSRHARMWFSLNNDLYLQMASNWLTKKEMLRKMLEQHFSHVDTKYDLFHELGGKTDHIRNYSPPRESSLDALIRKCFEASPSRDGIGMHLDHSEMRLKDVMPDTVTKWFDDTVTGMKKFDSDLFDSLDK